MGHSRTCSLDVLASKWDRRTTRVRVLARHRAVGLSAMELMMNAAKADKEK
jgi:hypothetical protein